MQHIAFFGIFPNAISTSITDIIFIHNLIHRINFTIAEQQIKFVRLCPSIAISNLSLAIINRVAIHPFFARLRLNSAKAIIFS